MLLHLLICSADLIDGAQKKHCTTQVHLWGVLSTVLSIMFALHVRDVYMEKHVMLAVPSQDA